MGLFEKSLAIAAMALLIFAATAVAVPASAANEVTVTKSASPTDIFVQGAGSPDTTKVTLSVQGFGGTLTQTLPIDVVFSIDSSGSMTINDPSHLRQAAAKTFVDKLDSSRDQGGVVSWDTGVNFAFGLTSDFNALKTHIDSVDAAGGTDLNVGLNAAIDMLDANTRVGQSTKVIVFLTDDVGSYTPAGSGGPAAEAAGKGYKIYSIALGGASAGPLVDMATATGGQFFNAPSAGNLDTIFNTILQTIVTNTAPYDVKLTETTQNYIVDESSFSIAPDSVTTLPGGQTQIVWNNIAQHVGDGNNKLTGNETLVVTFDAKSSLAGNNLPVDDLANSKVGYTNPDGSAGSVPLPQAFINVEGPPVAVNDSANTLEDTPVTINVLANDTDPNAGDVLSVISVGTPMQGTAVINADNTITYSPSPDIFDASDSFTYMIGDGHGLNSTATVTVNVAGLPNTAGKVTAGQANLDNDTNAGFNVQSSDGATFKGQLQYNDRLEDIKLHSDSMTSLSVDPTKTTATFKGTATVNGMSGYTFKVKVVDNGEPGTTDSFLIVIKDPTNATVYVKGAVLTVGTYRSTSK
jgi:Ca-activated chloride channel family protein